MDAGLAIEQAALASQKSMEDIIERGDSDIQRFYHDTTIFITGGTGFVGKQLIATLFRTCRVKKLYVLMRPKKGKSIYERLDNILKDPIFESLYLKRPDYMKKLIPIEGDMAELDLGINVEDRMIMSKEVEIIFHVAATISPEQPLGLQTLTNVRGTREVIALAKLCTLLKAFVHVSTAYSHATNYNIGTKILEKFYPSPISPELMIKLAEDLDENRLEMMKPGLIQEWPNGYSFTKALSEELIRTNAADLPACVIRPSIIICSRKGPCPGWVDINSVYGPSGYVLGALMGVIHVLFCRNEMKLDIVPVDYVCNAAIAYGSTARQLPLTVYHVASSCRNHLTWENIINILKNTISKTVVSDQAIWYCFGIQTNNKWIYLILSWLLHDLPGFIIDRILMTMGKSPKLTKLYRTINKMLSTLSFYTINGWNFDDENTLKQYEKLSEVDKEIYYHDIIDIEWTAMILIWYIGLRKYIVKDGLKNTHIGMKRQLYFKLATYFLSGLFISVIMFIIYLIILIAY